MKAYKIWNDVKHYIHKNTTCDLDILFTENVNNAKILPNYGSAVKFFIDKLGFDLNLCKSDPLYFE